MKSYLDWPLLKMVWKFWNGLQNEYVYNLSLWILITQCNYTYLYVYIQTFHACPSIHILQCKLPFLWNLQNPITLKWILWGLSVLIQIAFSCLYTKFEPILYVKKVEMPLRKPANVPHPRLPAPTSPTLKGCLHIFYYIKMAQIWHIGSWILSLSILKDPTKFILK